VLKLNIKNEVKRDVMEHRGQTRGPRAASGPARHFMWQEKKKKEKNPVLLF